MYSKNNPKYMPSKNQNTKNKRDLSTHYIRSRWARSWHNFIIRNILQAKIQK